MNSGSSINNTEHLIHQQYITSLEDERKYKWLPLHLYIWEGGDILACNLNDYIRYEYDNHFDGIAQKRCNSSAKASLYIFLELTHQFSSQAIKTSIYIKEQTSRNNGQRFSACLACNNIPSCTMVRTQKQITDHQLQVQVYNISEAFMPETHSQIARGVSLMLCQWNWHMANASCCLRVRSELAADNQLNVVCMHVKKSFFLLLPTSPNLGTLIKHTRVSVHPTS